METDLTTIDIVSGIFCEAVKGTLEKNTKKEINYSNTIQKIPKVRLKPEIGCFVQFGGDYNGLMIINFSAGAAMDIYRNYMTIMGLPEDALARDITSTEVVDTMGEMTNQITGQAMSMVENKFDLSSNFGQPKALALTNAITLTPDTGFNYNRRITFSIEGQRFHMELAMEQTEFISMDSGSKS